MQVSENGDHTVASRLRPLRVLLVLSFAFFALPIPAVADGKVFPQVFSPVVQTPDQQAFIQFSGGVERLVIETSLAGSGTNFAWVVPLPSAPRIEPVSEYFFVTLRSAFRSHLIHDVHRYYVGALFLAGFFFLGWRSLKDEVTWVKDVPLCLGLSGAAWLASRSVIVGALTMAFVLYVRLFTRSPTNFGLVMLIGTALAAFLSIAPSDYKLLPITYLGQDSSSHGNEDDVNILSVEQAGVFESATIQSSNPRAILDWLNDNGYATPKAAEPVIQHYVQNRWVFVASKIRRDSYAENHTTIHPLAFIFPARDPIYPMRLTGVESGDLAVDLYVFGDQRATAPHFEATRCDQVARNLKPGERPPGSWLRIRDPEISSLVAGSTVGTKLSGHLTPQQMESDVNLQWSGFRARGARVYSGHGAQTIALNVALPMAVAGWLLVGATHGGWNIDERKILRWRCLFVTLSILTGLTIFLLLPQVEIAGR